MKTYIKIYLALVGVALAFLLFLTAVTIDSLWLDYRYQYDFVLEDECDYELPSDHDKYGRWEIITNGEMFAVKRHWLNRDEYLCQGLYGMTMYSTTITTPILFFSECRAKAAIKKFVEDWYGVKDPF